MEDFCSDPDNQLDRIYTYINEARFEHDLARIDTVPAEHDGIHAPLGDHTLTAPTVRPVPERWDALLGGDLAAGIVDGNRWFYAAFYPERL
jgi:hypothetical protein